MNRCLAILLLLAAVHLAISAERAAPSWKAGVASVVITPDSDMWMAGYAARNKPSEGKAQDLFAKALALDDNAGGRLVIVTMDLIGVPRDLRLNLAKRLKESHNLAPEQILLNASHTHCGPEFRVGRPPLDSTDEEKERSSRGGEYGRQLEEKLFKLVGDALRTVAHASLAYSRARVGFAMNRRLPSPTGYQNSPNPDGPVDHEVPILSVTGADGKLRAVLFGYACHNTTLAFYEFCGDYAGYAQEYLQEDHPGTSAMFLNGCSGDQNPYPRRMLEHAKYHGRSLATAVDAALTVSKPRPVSGPLRGAYEEIALEYDTLPTREEFTARLTSKDKYAAAHARRMLDRLDAEGRLPVDYPYPIQVAHFGTDIVLVALAGEVVVDYSLRLKKDLAGKAAVWVAGYSNDVMGYIPSKRVREEGGYEAADAMRFSATHPGPWAPVLEERIVSKVTELHRRLQQP